MAGSPATQRQLRDRFDQAIEETDVDRAWQLAADLDFVSIDRALALTMLLGQRADPRFEAAAVRFVGRFAVELKPTLAQISKVAQALETMRRVGDLPAMSEGAARALEDLGASFGVDALFRSGSEASGGSAARAYATGLSESGGGTSKHVIDATVGMPFSREVRRRSSLAACSAMTRSSASFRIFPTAEKPSASSSIGVRLRCRESRESKVPPFRARAASCTIRSIP